MISPGYSIGMSVASTKASSLAKLRQHQTAMVYVLHENEIENTGYVNVWGQYLDEGTYILHANLSSDISETSHAYDANYSRHHKYALFYDDCIQAKQGVSAPMDGDEFSTQITHHFTLDTAQLVSIYASLMKVKADSGTFAVTTDAKILNWKNTGYRTGGIVTILKLI